MKEDTQMATRKPRNVEREISIERWTWHDAEEALQKNHINRYLKDFEVEKYARAMVTKDVDGKSMWGLDTHPICFDWFGNLIDGQHRLSAQVMTKTTREWLVYRGLPPETQKSINTGRPRSPADQLRLDGYANTVVLSSVARWSYMLLNDKVSHGRFKVSSEEIVEMVRAHPDLEHSATMGTYARSGFVEINPSPTGAAHWWIAQHNNHAEADLFIDRFVHINREPDGSAVLALMRRFNEVRRHKQTVPTRVQVGMIIKAWNYDVKRVHVSKINLYSRSGEFKIQTPLKREHSQTIETPLEGTQSSDDEEE